MNIREVRVYPYEPSEFGLLKAKRRLTRIQFVAVGGPRSPLPLTEIDVSKLPEVFKVIARSVYAPIPWPEDVRQEWDEDCREFVLHNSDLKGFWALVMVERDAAPELTGSVRTGEKPQGGVETHA